MSQACPICHCTLSAHPQYPHYVCIPCAERACDGKGRQLKLSNAGPTGGYAAAYADNSEVYNSNEVYVDGVACWAEAARFGGIVIQARRADTI